MPLLPSPALIEFTAGADPNAIPQGGPLTEDLAGGGYDFTGVGDLVITGLPGATTPTRIAGGTASGPPSTGTFAQNDAVIDATGTLWICAVGGTPGTWFRPHRRTASIASSATPAINTDAVDYFTITALAVAITSMTTSLTGTPTEGQQLWIAVTDNGSPRAIAWGASFEASGAVALPTTTSTSVRKDISFVFNSATSKWRCVLVA